MVHPTGLSPDGGAAFRHALAVALAGGPGMAVETLHLADGPSAEVIVFHAGPEDAMPAVGRPELPGIAWRERSSRAEPAAAICQAARGEGVDRITMTTRGRQGILNALRGSVTERVVRESGLPVLAAPV